MSRAPHGLSISLSIGSAANERDSTRQARDLAAMRRMLEVTEGCFSLSFAVCNDRTLRNELIEQLCAEFSGVVVAKLPAETGDVYQTVCDQLSDGSPRALFVVDLEASVPFEAKTYPTLRSLNSSREFWERLACPVVFWLAEYAVALVARQAPDFWRYRSHQFEFVSDRGTVRAALPEPFPGFDMVDGLPFEEKRFRVAELEQRLREAGVKPSLDLLPHALNWLFELAHLYGHASQFDRARELLDRAVSWSEAAYGPNDPRSATSLNNLAYLLKNTNRLTEAEPLMRRALAIDEQTYGKDDPKLTAALNNLAAVLGATNRLAEAEALMQRALAINEQRFGNDHPNVARDLSNLAVLFMATNRLAEAEPLMARVLTIFGKSFGENHPRMAAALINMAQLLQSTNRLADAEPLLRRALAIEKQSFGNDHPNVAIALNNLAKLLQATNRLDEAEPLLRRALVIFWKSLGDQHPDTQKVRKNYELLLKDMGHNQAKIKQRLDEIQRALG